MFGQVEVMALRMAKEPKQKPQWQSVVRSKEPGPKCNKYAISKQHAATDQCYTSVPFLIFRHMAHGVVDATEQINISGEIDQPAAIEQIQPCVMDHGGGLES